MHAQRLARAVANARRAIPSLGLAGMVAAAALGSAAMAIAAPPPEEPAARLHVIIHDITIHDDREGRFSGDGEFVLDVLVWHCEGGAPPPCSPPVDLVTDPFQNWNGVKVHARERFGGYTGDVVKLTRGVPTNGDRIYGGHTSTALGFPVFRSKANVVQFIMHESDHNTTVFNSDEYMGSITHAIDFGEHGLGIGTHTVRSFRDEQYEQGDYTVTYEIRRASVPDLRPGGIKVHDLPGSPNKRVCMGVANHEEFSAGPFEVELRIDGEVPTNGRASVPHLLAGASAEPCVTVAFPTTGRHTLSAHVDEKRAVFEFDEANNVYELAYETTGRAAAQAGTPSADRADLIVSEIKVDGRAPDGKDDCKDGKHDVAVVVKNRGDAAAADIVVRLAVDGAAPIDKNIGDLDATKQREVRFEDVPLKKGERKVVATVDAKNEVAESDEGNNGLTVTARCKGG